MTQQINYELLEKVKMRLKRMRHLSHFDMGTFGAVTECGTTACIAGHAILINGEMNARELVTVNNSVFDNANPVEECALKLLGLTPEQANRLFYVAYWPVSMKEAYEDAEEEEDDALRRDIAVRRIQRFIDSKGKE